MAGLNNSVLYKVMKVQTANRVHSKKLKWCHSEFISESLTQVTLRDCDPEGSGQNEKNAKNYYSINELHRCIGLETRDLIWRRGFGLMRFFDSSSRAVGMTRSK